MKLIPVNKIRNTMVLGKSIYTINNKLLLGAGHRISHEIKEIFIEKGYNHVYIMDETANDIIPEYIISDEVINQANYKLSDKTEKTQKRIKFNNISRERINNQLQSGFLKDIITPYDIGQVSEELLTTISHIGASTLNTFLVNSKSSYHFDHALNSTVIATLIGKKYGLTSEELQNLSTGVFLHDLGKIVVEKMKEKSNPSTIESLEKEHPLFGYLIIHNSKAASSTVGRIVKQHHEHQDGSGYPFGLHGENLPPTNTTLRKRVGMIHRLAEICTVADAYDNLVMNPSIEKRLTPSETVKFLIQYAGTIYNKHIVSTLTTFFPYLPTGSIVKIRKLVDTSLIGYTGIVAKTNQDNLDKPIILLTEDKVKRKIKPPRLIDTSRLSFIDLELIL